MQRTVFLGSDHGGFALKESIRQWLSENPQLLADPVDDGPYEHDPTDSYVPAGAAVARDVALEHISVEENPAAFGILSCRSGGGMAIVANRFQNVRAVVCRTVADAEHARRHDNANVLVLQGDQVSPELALQIVKVFLQASFDGGRHIDRLQSIEDLEL